MSEVHEIADGIYRISHFDGNYAPVEFTQFLIKDERSLAGWQSGFFTASGARKPSYTAFRRLKH